MAEWEQGIAALKQAYADWEQSKGDPEVWRDVIADEIDFRSLGGSLAGLPWARPHTSRAGVQEYLGGLTGEWDMIHYQVERYVCQDDAVVVIGDTSWRNKKTRKRLDTPIVAVWRFKDGKAVGFHEYFDTATLASCMCD